MEFQPENIVLNFATYKDLSWMSQEQRTEYIVAAKLPSRRPVLDVLVFFTANTTSHQLTRTISPDRQIATYRYHSIISPSQIIASVSNSRTTTAATTFHPFTKLPLELRIMIWGFSIPDSSRTIELRLSHSLVRKGRSPRYDLVSPSSPPSILLACHESRSVALAPIPNPILTPNPDPDPDPTSKSKSNSKSRTNPYTPSTFSLPYKCPQGIPFNLPLDTLHLRGAQWYNPTFIRTVIPLIPHLLSVRHLSFTDDFWPGCHSMSDLLAPLLRFGCLETLTLCCQLKGLGCVAEGEGDGVKRTHPGGCHTQGTAGSCFVDENEIAPAYAGAVRQRMQYMEDEYSAFMREVRCGGFGELETETSVEVENQVENQVEVEGRKERKQQEKKRLRIKEIHMLDTLQQSFGHGWQEPAQVFFKAVCVAGVPEGEFSLPLLDRFQRRWSLGVGIGAGASAGAGDGVPVSVGL
ncbi:hypothetical protein IFR05_003699 [Cadophora sp. M221]|nr:hypothetical protein IFR05_003699 [Cadophora sp. M221]